MVDIKIYSAETSIRQVLARIGYDLASLNKFDICHRHAQ